MANTVEVQTINDGDRNLVIKVHIDGDGSGEETATNIVDISTLSGSPTSLRLLSILSGFVGFSAELLWDATADVHLFEIPDYELDMCFKHFGGIPNNAGAGVTGDVLITTTGLGLGDTGHAVLHFIKTY